MGKDKFLFWFPRIASIIFAVFLFLFSLDVFEQATGFWETILALIVHNIPALILLAVAVVSWKLEIVGAISFIAAGLLYAFLILSNSLKNGFEWYYLSWVIQISGIAFLVGIIFWVGWIRKRKE